MTRRVTRISTIRRSTTSWTSVFPFFNSRRLASRLPRDVALEAAANLVAIPRVLFDRPLATAVSIAGQSARFRTARVTNLRNDAKLRLEPLAKCGLEESLVCVEVRRLQAGDQFRHVHESAFRRGTKHAQRAGDTQAAPFRLSASRRFID